jgi:chromate transporter
VTDDHRAERVGLGAIALAFLKLGTIAFGGPAAHIAMMEQEFVRRRHWLSEQEFLDRLGAANLIPGPSSTEMAIFIGHNKRGWPGLIVAGSCFIIPAAILVSLIAAAYVRFGSLPQVNGILYAVKPVVIAVIVQAFWKLSRTAIKSRLLAVIGVAATVAALLGVENLLLLVCCGLLAAIPVLARKLELQSKAAPLGILFGNRTKILALIGLAGTAAAVPFSLMRLFLTFLKIGSVLFGSGYVLLAFLRADFVVRLHWLTEKQVLDAVAVGQVTPGPVFTTATFIGYVLAGIPGAIAATVAIFLPGFLLVAASGPLIPRIRRSPLAGSILDGVVAGSLALIGVVSWQLGRAALIDPLTIAIACLSALLLFAFRINTAWLVLAAALVGFFHH